MGFLALFLIKALFFIKRFGQTNDIEITAKEEPELFHFINKVADDTGAPRPHKVFLSPQVNAAVFYDLSILNLVYPTKKNLEIGLGLVNSLTLNEFKAVLAHEFGHFAQKSMAVGRYVYVSRQIASHIINKRDVFDSFLQGLSSFDIRIAWLGWLLSILVWSIRALVDTVFLVVILAERALSREMEFQADLVAVSLTGSDAIVNGLYKLEAADNAWEQSIQYCFEALHEGKAISDIFALQSYFVKKIGTILDKPDYGNPPVLEDPAHQRLFKKQLVNPAKMWSTHPPAYEREENAKRIYIKTNADSRSPWILFKDSDDVKKRMTEHILEFDSQKEKPKEKITDYQAIEALDKKYNKIFHDPKYRGYYLKHSIAREVEHAEDLFTFSIREEEITGILTSLYPESLKQELELFENKNEEISMLKALSEKAWDAKGDVIFHEGKEIKRNELPALIESLSSEIKGFQNKFHEYNKKVRTVHYKIAEKLHPSWGSYLKGLSALVHYCEHNLANLRDAQGLLNNTLAIVLADSKVSSSEMRRILTDANGLNEILEGIYTNADQVTPDEQVLRRLEADSWASLLEEYKLGYASEGNINSWLQSVDSWVNLAVDRLIKLQEAALEELIQTEEKLAAAFIAGSDPGYAPSSSVISYNYPRLLYGNERKLQNKLSLWERFYTADGLVPSIARLTVAASIIGAAIFVGQSINTSELIIYNGLSIPVIASVDGETLEINPHGYKRTDLEYSDDVSIESRTSGGLLIEKFKPELDSKTHTYIYNVASAAGMLKWDVFYSTFSNQEPRQTNLGSPKWFISDVDYYFTDPPQSITTSGSSETRDVLTAFSEFHPANILSFAKDKSDSINLIKAHALWDDGKSKNVLHWLSLASQLQDGLQIIQSRLANYKDEVLALRFLQDLQFPDGKDNIRIQFEEKFKANPENPDLYYLAKRCLNDGPDQSQSFIDGYQKWPDNGWLSFAGGYAFTEQEKWQEAEKALLNAVQKEPSLFDPISVDLIRIYRLNRSGLGDYSSEAWKSTEFLQYIQIVESGLSDDSISLAYNRLFTGKLEEALLFAQETEGEDYFLRLAAASDGASDELIQRSFNLKPDEGINFNTIASTIGLAAREGQDISPYLSILKPLAPEESGIFEAFISALQKGTSPVEAEALLKQLRVQVKGQAYALGSVYLGKNAPESWKKKAAMLLFITERPYFKVD